MGIKAMRATIIIKAEPDGKIVKLVDISSIDEVTVRTAVDELELLFPGHVIDTSQVEFARQALRAA